MAKLSGIYVLREGEQTLAGMTVEIVLIRDVESLTEILDEVLLVFDADRETYQLVGDADLQTLGDVYKRQPSDAPRAAVRNASCGTAVRQAIPPRPETPPNGRYAGCRARPQGRRPAPLRSSVRHLSLIHI